MRGTAHVRGGGAYAQPQRPARRPPLPQGPYAVLGLARSGIAAALALAQRGEQVIGLDARRPEDAAQLTASGVEIRTGEQARALPEHARVLIKSPGVPQHAPAVASARERGLPVLGELELAWRMLENEFVAVTGTNGKTTTAELIGHIHSEAGLPAAVAGNVGTALSSLAGEVSERATVVCEASSFQLEDTLAFAPEAAVLVNLTPDHLDRHGSFDAYARAKANAFARQRAEDVAVLPSSLLEASADRGAAAPVSEPAALLRSAGSARRVGFGAGAAADLCERDGELFWGERRLLAAAELRLRGRHNVENAMAAAAVCLARGVEAKAVAAGLRSFAGVRHRLEQVALRAGVCFVNDSKATNVASTLVALDAFADTRGVRLILGGQGKGQDFTALRGAVQERCRGVYLIGEDAPTIARALAGAGVALHSCGELERALARAAQEARAGEVVLLSPACASFDQFRDFEARGERFSELVLA